MADDYEVIGHDSEGNEIIEGEVLENLDQELEEVSDFWKLVAYHLQNNLHPPVPLNMVETCIEAITRANEGEWDSLITLPEGTKYKGESEASVEVIVEGHYLQDFIKTAREVVTITGDDGTVIYQGYGTELKLEPSQELNKSIDNDPESYGIEK